MLVHVMCRSSIINININIADQDQILRCRALRTRFMGTLTPELKSTQLRWVVKSSSKRALTRHASVRVVICLPPFAVSQYSTAPHPKKKSPASRAVARSSGEGTVAVCVVVFVALKKTGLETTFFSFEKNGRLRSIGPCLKQPTQQSKNGCIF
jgi:hypothetical protein